MGSIGAYFDTAKGRFWYGVAALIIEVIAPIGFFVIYLKMQPNVLLKLKKFGGVLITGAKIEEKTETSVDSKVSTVDLKKHTIF